MEVYYNIWLLFFLNYLFIWLHEVLVTALGILFPEQGLNPGPLHWKHRVLATEPPGKSFDWVFMYVWNSL